MQQHNHSIKQSNDLHDFEKNNKLQQRKIRSTSHSRLRSSTNSVKNIVTSKSIENGKKCHGQYNCTQYLNIMSKHT